MLLQTVAQLQQKKIANSAPEVPPVTATSAQAADNQSEAMSNSTISKAEDAHRIKDLEESFEERYMKLKSVAIKIKKKLAEVTIELNNSEDKNKKLSAEIEQLSSMKNASKNIQILQVEIDRLQDAVDVSKTQIKERDGQLANAASQLAQTKDQLAKALGDVDNLNASLKLSEESVLASNKKQEELQVKVSDLLQQASGQVQEENKQLNLLTLQLQDSEQTVADLQMQLSLKESVASRDKNELASLQQRISTLEAQLEQLSAKSAADESTAQCLRTSSDEVKTQLLEAEKELITLRLSKQQQTAEIERLMNEVESQRECATDVSQSKARLEEQSRLSRTNYCKQIAQLEDKVESLTKELSDVTAELEFVKKEHETYKIRAQNVLKQQQQKQSNSVDVNDLQNRLQHCETQVQTLQHSNRQLQSEVSALQSEQKFMLSEKERLLKQHKQDYEKQSHEISKLQEEKLDLERKLQEEVSKSQAVISKMASEGEAMAKSYDTQLKSKDYAHEQEITNLQLKLDSLKRQLEGSKGTADEPYHSDEKLSSKQIHEASEDFKVDVTSMIREEGEGSEWVDSLPTHHRSHSSANRLLSEPAYQQPPLHQLILPDDSVSVASSATEQLSTSYLTSQVTSLQSKVDAFELRVQQVSSLLHESEAENSKLTQLTDALKEEIRRNSRNNDREKHLENLEYVKNVVLQFITLGTAADAKERLLPVLTTLLQLSPPEVEKIKMAVKGTSKCYKPNFMKYNYFSEFYIGR